MAFLHELPTWAMGAVVVGGCVTAATVGQRLVQALITRPLSDQEFDGAMAMMGVAATITSLLLAFSAVSVWETNKAADAGVTSEASTCAMLANDLGAYGSPEALQAREAVRAYTQVVLKEEWPLLARGEASDSAWTQLDTIYRLAHRIEARSLQESAFLGEIWGRINEIVKFRRDRLHAAQSTVPSTLWAVVVVGGILTFSFAYTLPRTRLSRFLLAGMAATLGLVFHFIIAMELPFSGPDGVGPEPLELVLRNMDRWDAATRGDAPPLTR